MQQAALLIMYCLLIALAALAGGWLPMLLRLSHTGMQMAMSFIGGTMLGVGILHLLPHAFLELRSIYPCVWWMLGGFLTMFFIERVFHFHHHDAPTDVEETAPAHAHQHHGHAHDHAHCDHTHEDHHGGEAQRGWQAALVGLALHSAADGMALAASVAAEPVDEGSWFLTSGLAVFLVIVLHKPFDSLTLSTLMAVSHTSKRARHIVNLLYATAVPLGVALFLLGVGESNTPERSILGAALAFSAGTFLCISTSDLLPELQFHAHDRVKLSASLLLGLAVAAGIVLIESSTHDHGGGEHGDVTVHEHGTGQEHSAASR